MLERVTAVDEFLKEYEDPNACAAQLLCDGHDPDAIAFTLIEADLSSEDITYGQLRERSEQGAAALADLGVGPGDTVATLMGKSAELVVMLLAIWRRGAVHVPLFTAFAWPAIELRLTASAAKVIITDANQRSKLQHTSAQIIVAGDFATAPDLALEPLLCAHQSGIPAESVGGDGLLVMIFTSGTTGHPKGVPVPVRALASFRQYVEVGLDVQENDVFWNAADPGWAYGLYYAILGPLAAGRRSLLLHAGFSPELSFAVLERFGVTNFAAAPTVYRAMRAKPATAALSLRRASSAGEPLTPEVTSWAEATFGVPVRDQYGQTENGMMIINSWHDDVRQDLKPGSMGQPLPGWTCAVLDNDSDTLAGTNVVGRVAVDAQASPMMWFTGYHNAPERTTQQFSTDRRWYLTGDAGKMDADGYYFFSSRDDDVILMAGYRIGPFDVESALATHPAVLESAVIGVPDDLRGEVLEAYVVLKEDVSGDDSLVAELQNWVKTHFAAHAFPRQVHFVDQLPKTPSGKIQRFILRRDRARQS